MNRREVLLGGLCGCIGGLAGCAVLNSEDASERSKPQPEVFVTNATQESLTLTVRALRGSTEFFSHTYTLAPGNGDESESFVGTPTEVYISIQNGRTVTREYSVPASCESPDVNVTIEPDAIMVTNGCTTS